MYIMFQLFNMSVIVNSIDHSYKREKDEFKLVCASEKRNTICSKSASVVTGPWSL